ncbi:MAG: uroporphyrinogen decarboxylase/cobalamine-independent methonine synthase family protein [Candidatus Geothermincolia bacterium]
MQFEPRFAMIAIGSLPHTDAELATRLMLEAFPEVAAWPQLPRLSFRENMYAQYSEGMPGIRVDTSGKRLLFQVDESLPAELEEFYQAVIDEDLDRFRISREYAAGLDLFLAGAFADELAGRPYVKGHMTGPISFGLTVTDQNKRASLYNEDLEQAIVKALTLKGAWQSRELRRVAPNAKVVMFYDEPYLHSVGSALISVSREQVMGHITECLQGCGADITGVHCCGNTDWSLVFGTGVDIVHFDAYEYMEPFVAYDREIGEHVERGGAIAWGVIPKDENVMTVSSDELADRLEAGFDVLEGKGVDRQKLARRSLVSPSCGLGSATIEIADRALALTREVSEEMRRRYS